MKKHFQAKSEYPNRSLRSDIERVRSEINLHFYVLRHPHGKVQGRRIAGYSTDEQRSHVGWISSSKYEVIFERTLSKGR